MRAIEFDDVSLTLGSRAVLAHVALAIESGEFIGVLGPNGAGKTTLMRAVLGLVRPSEGRIQVFGRPATRGSAAIGYLPQVHHGPGSIRLRAFDYLASVIDGQRLGLPLLGRRGRAEVERVLQLTGASELSQRLVGELSGGERQRLLLAQALIGRPRLLLLDEPLISLDPPHQRHVVELVQSLRDELGVTVLFSAHELNPLLGALDRVLYLGQRQAALGVVDEVITGPVLSRLYGAPVEVLRVMGRIFVMSGSHDVEQQPHRHGDHAQLEPPAAARGHGDV